jgi:hypothetical protein
MDSSERPWQPKERQRPITAALRAYARMATSADTGAVRDPNKSRCIPTLKGTFIASDATKVPFQHEKDPFTTERARSR